MTTLMPRERRGEGLSFTPDERRQQWSRIGVVRCCRGRQQQPHATYEEGTGSMQPEASVAEGIVNLAASVDLKKTATTAMAMCNT